MLIWWFLVNVQNANFSQIDYVIATSIYVSVWKCSTLHVHTEWILDEKWTENE